MQWLRTTTMVVRVMFTVSSGSRPETCITFWKSSCGRSFRDVPQFSTTLFGAQVCSCCNEKNMWPSFAALLAVLMRRRKRRSAAEQSRAGSKAFQLAKGANEHLQSNGGTSGGCTPGNGTDDSDGLGVATESVHPSYITGSRSPSATSHSALSNFQSPAVSVHHWWRLDHQPLCARPLDLW